MSRSNARKTIVLSMPAAAGAGAGVAPESSLKFEASLSAIKLSLERKIQRLEWDSAWNAQRSIDIFKETVSSLRSDLRELQEQSLKRACVYVEEAAIQNYLRFCMILLLERSIILRRPHGLTIGDDPKVNLFNNFLTTLRSSELIKKLSIEEMIDSFKQLSNETYTMARTLFIARERTPAYVLLDYIVPEVLRRVSLGEISSENTALLKLKATINLSAFNEALEGKPFDIRFSTARPPEAEPVCIKPSVSTSVSEGLSSREAATTEVVCKIKAFSKIYTALFLSQSSIFKFNFLAGKATLSLLDITEYARQHPTSKVCKAWDLAQIHHGNCSDKNVDLVAEIYAYSVEKSTKPFAHSKATGTFFYVSSYRESACPKPTAEQIAVARTKEGSRTALIVQSLAAR